MSKIYTKYRKRAFNRGQGLYDLSYIYNQERKWYIDNKGVVIGDNEIPEFCYTEASKGRKLAICEYTADADFTEADFTADLESYTEFATRILAAADAQAFIDDNTDPTKLIKESTGVYYYNSTDEEGNPIKVYIPTID